MSTNLKHSVNAHRAMLKDMLGTELVRFTDTVLPVLDERDRLDGQLSEIFQQLDYCKYIYALDKNAVQLSSTINRYGADEHAVNRDRSQRPYILPALINPSTEFHLSEAYISRNKKRPTITAIQSIYDSSGERRGFLGVDFDLRDLPHSEVLYEEPSQWRQIKGDPAIRSGLFQQQRVDSLLDQQIDHVMSVHEALMIDQGVHHVLIHFSSSRSTIWHIDDPFVYRLLTMDELSDTSIFHAYPGRSYFERNVVPSSAIAPILNLFKALRFSDETIYLRSGGLNLINGKVELNFSCDGTHYLNYKEFLEQGLEFWFGPDTCPQTTQTDEAGELNHARLERLIVELAAEGCSRINKLLNELEQNTIPENLANYSDAEREFIYTELKSVMEVYEDVAG